MSFPHGAAVNDFIDKGKFMERDIDFVLPSVDSLVFLVVKHGVGTLCWKRDMASCYYQIPVRIKDIHLQGFVWKGQKFYFASLVMGCSSAAYCWQRVTTMIKRIMAARGFDIESYLDDMGSAGPPMVAIKSYYSL